METQHGTHFPTHFVLFVGREQERHHGPGSSGGRFDDVRGIALVAGLVEVLQLGATGCRVGLQVKVGAIGNTFKFAPAPREEELNVGRTG
ncbi:unannotated protein [freshwater metagenome]|uniref:Unannotated protein n=1 Tax=freshwater metagenome TaxID=449393 RepID=A0A6J6WZI6_9ZZZZ